MELESTKYKKRLIIISIIIILSIVLGYFVKDTLKQTADELETVVQNLQGTTEEEYNKTIQEKIDKGEQINSSYESKEKAIATLNTILVPYRAVFAYSGIAVTIIFAYALSASMIAIMMIYIFANFIFKKIWKDIENWMLTVLSIIIIGLSLTTPITLYITITIGIIGQIPFIIYTVVKYIKTKKIEDKDDIIDPVKTKGRQKDTIEEK